jgi:hypothetical protein
LPHLSEDDARRTFATLRHLVVIDLVSSTGPLRDVAR